ncbi:MAG: 50S ribosomal protein L15 [Actinobacteria bacterium]|nr:50S ribosomal protein L15 [Actinomycetota bacterium]
MAIKLHHLRPAPGAHKAKTRKGRGEGSKGKTAGRGTKGSGARTTVRPGFEGGQMPLYMRLPKLKGFTNPFRVEYQAVNLDDISRVFPQGGAIGVQELSAKGLARKGRLVKILGTGEMTCVAQVSAHAFSSSAEKKIVAAGGSVNRISK